MTYIRLRLLLILFLEIIICAILLAACGGSDTETVQYQLVMQRTDNSSETLYIYNTAEECTAAGSYRIFNQPQRYTGYSCKEV